MNTREQFGKYLLLKKLTEDALGETFRAGKLGDGGMERVVLLRVLNGQGVDGPRLWQATRNRVAIPKQLRNPNIGEGIEMGEIQGLPYVAYDYISGKNMADLLEQAARSRNYVPAEHALLITERVALALAAASESRLEGERILHGFVTPHLVMISNEGEARLLGFEIGPGLRTFATHPVIRQHFGRYLSPETLSGQPPHPADDIYSLGVVLYELLTGRPLPPPASDGFGSIIDQGVVATQGTPIPTELQNLLKRSLVAREQRIGDVGAWHKSLNKIMFDGQYNPTTFNLAFFMHNLFRQDIERESQEIEVEKTLPLPTLQRPATGAVTQPVQILDDSTGVRQATAGEASGVHEATGVREAAALHEPKKSKGGLLAAVAVIVLLGAGGGYWLWSQNQSSEQVASQSAPPPPPPVVEPEPVPAGPTEEELNTMINELIEQRTEGISEELNKRYTQEIATLQKQLDQAKKDAETRRQRDLELEAERVRQKEEDEKARKAQEIAEQKAAEEAAAKAAAEEAKKTAAEIQVAEQAPPPQQVAPPPPSSPPPPRAPQVRRGDLVEPGPGVVPPRLVRRPDPRFPEQARRLNRQSAKVTIRALIDEYGKVVKADLVGDKQGWGFDTEALNSVKRSIYEPATKDGVPVKMWLTLAVEFRQ